MSAAAESRLLSRGFRPHPGPRVERYDADPIYPGRIILSISPGAPAVTNHTTDHDATPPLGVRTQPKPSERQLISDAAGRVRSAEKHLQALRAFLNPGRVMSADTVAAAMEDLRIALVSMDTALEIWSRA